MAFTPDKTPCQCGHERWQHNGMGQCRVAVTAKTWCRCNAFVAKK